MWESRPMPALILPFEGPACFALQGLRFFPFRNLAAPSKARLAPLRGVLPRPVITHDAASKAVLLRVMYQRVHLPSQNGFFLQRTAMTAKKRR